MAIDGDEIRSKRNCNDCDAKVYRPLFLFIRKRHWIRNKTGERVCECLQFAQFYQAIIILLKHNANIHTTFPLHHLAHFTRKPTLSLVWMRWCVNMWAYIWARMAMLHSIIHNTATTTPTLTTATTAIIPVNERHTPNAPTHWTQSWENHLIRSLL